MMLLSREQSSVRGESYCLCVDTLTLHMGQVLVVLREEERERGGRK